MFALTPSLPPAPPAQEPQCVHLQDGDKESLPSLQPVGWTEGDAAVSLAAGQWCNALVMSDGWLPRSA